MLMTTSLSKNLNPKRRNYEYDRQNVRIREAASGKDSKTKLYCANYGAQRYTLNLLRICLIDKGGSSKSKAIAVASSDEDDSSSAPQTPLPTSSSLF
jgi:hypothetical protein